jgi:hypothetical protein
MPGDGTCRDAPPSNDDIARVAVAALTDPGTHAGKTYRPTGPKLLSIKDMADILSKVLGHKVRHVSTPMWMYFKAARMGGTSPILMHGLRYYMEEVARGTFEFGAPTNHVYEVTGRQPEDFETIARRHALLPESRRTPCRQLRAFADFMTVPMRPGFNPFRFAREQGFPMPENPLLDLDNRRWKLEHSAASIDAARSRAPGREFRYLPEPCSCHRVSTTANRARPPPNRPGTGASLPKIRADDIQYVVINEDR